MEIFELLGRWLFDYLPSAIRNIGAAVRWSYLRKQYTFKEILEMGGNGGVGLVIVVPVIASVVVYCLY